MDKAAQFSAAQRLKTQHWWDDHPPADPINEPLYAQALEGHVSEVA